MDKERLKVKNTQLGLIVITKKSLKANLKHLSKQTPNVRLSSVYYLQSFRV